MGAVDCLQYASSDWASTTASCVRGQTYEDIFTMADTGENAAQAIPLLLNYSTSPCMQRLAMCHPQ